MSISTQCGKCGQQYTVSDALAGKKAKCKKCGAVITIPDSNEPVVADLGDDPLAGLGDWEAAGDPLGPSPLMASSRPAAGKPVAKSKGAASGGDGIPQVVWIACGAGGGVLLLLVVLIFFVFRGSGGDNPPAVAQGESGTSTDGGDSTTVAPAGTTETSPPGSTDTTGGSSSSPPSTPPTTPAAKPSMAEVNDSIPWKWQPETLPAAPQGLLAKPLRLADNPQSVFITRADVAQAVVSYARYGQQRDTLVQRIDLKSGQVVGERSFAQNAKLLDASLDGTTFLLLPAESYASQEDLEVWQWKDAGAERVAGWKPYAAETVRRYAWAMMLDANRVLTYPTSGEAAIAWDASKTAEAYRVPCKSTWPPSISPGGKYLVLHSGLWLRFFNTTDGKHVGSLGPLSGDYVSLTAAAFSRDGKSIAATFVAPTGGSHTVAVFDTAQGRQTHGIEVPLAADHLQWVGGQYLLSGAHLVSLEHEMTVWNYLGLQPYRQAVDERAWSTVRAGSEIYLMAAPVPSSEVAGKIGAYVAANTPVLQAGDSVSLQVTAGSQSARANLQQELTETFRGKLTAAGYQVAEGQPFRLVVNVSEEDSGRQLEYRTFGGGAGGATTVQVPDRRLVCKVAFVDKDNQEVWQQATTIGPASFSMNRDGGDFVTQLLANRWTGLDNWIEHLQITALVRKFSSTGKFGQSMLQPTGERILSVPTP